MPSTELTAVEAAATYTASSSTALTTVEATATLTVSSSSSEAAAVEAAVLSVVETTGGRKSVAAAPIYSFLLASEALKGYDIASMTSSEESFPDPFAVGPASSVTPDDVKGALNRGDEVNGAAVNGSEAVVAEVPATTVAATTVVAAQDVNMSVLNDDDDDS